ncbi:DMT family transporter [Altererythrobacter sp.]|uniref:DMT family transporter n=1 Tax=Altererythrobacter sp. TaxID=1872480 RepID=UPI003D01B808
MALLLRLGAAAVIAMLTATVKLAEQSGVSLPEILFWRQAPTVPILLLWLAASGGLSRLLTHRIGAHAKRAILGLASMSCNFGAVILLPLAEATTLVFTSSIFAVILSAVLLKEDVGIYRWTAVTLGFLGVVVIARPGSGEIPLLGAAIALSAAFMIALISIQIRDLGRTEEPITVVFYFSLFSLPILGAILPFVYQTHSAYQWMLLGAISLLGLLVQLLLTASLRFGVVASVMVMDYTSLLWATLLGWSLFDHLPPATTWLGAPLVVLAGLVIAWREHRLAIASRGSAPIG